MNELNGKIRRALAEEGLDPRDFEREQSIFELLIDTFRGRQRGLNLLGVVLQLIYLGLTIWAAVRFFDAPETREQILWSALFISCLGITMSFKIWFWMVMNRNAVLREVKRLELQVARLAAGEGG